MDFKINIPLECQDPKSFDHLDSGQKRSIKTGALDLVLLENAAEIVKRVMFLEAADHIEKILKVIAKSKGCISIPSQSFPLWMDPKLTYYTEKGSPDINKNKNMIPYHLEELDIGDTNEKEYMRLMNQTKKEVNNLKRGRKDGCLFSTFALNLGEDSGHYAGFYYDIKTKKVEIFDSMQTAEIGSDYTPFFRQLGAHVFGVKISETKADTRFTPRLSLQYTGGFLEHPSVMVEEEGDIKKYSHLNEQSTESQNHFCYMWAIWFIHHKIMGCDVYKSAIDIREKHIDPLVVIKRYIWALFHIDLDGLILADQIPPEHRKFFDRNFLRVWTNDPERKFVINENFKLYRIPTPMAKTVGECLSESLRSEKLDWVEPTTKTDAMKKCGIKL